MDGILIINKPKGRTSHDIVAKVKKIVNDKVGHTGTLDPNATGVLPLLIGKGTLCSQYLIEHDKIYEATIKLGIKTDTADIEGKIIEEREVLLKTLEEQNIKKVLKEFLGKQEQIPPIYSAIKVNGKKLYEYARNNEEVTLPKKEVTIYSLELISITNDIITIKTKVSKGTYIRALINDIGQKLNTNGTLISLERTSLDKFKISDAYSLKDVLDGNYKLLSIEDLINCKVINIDDNLLFKVKNGQRLKMNDEYVLFKYNSLNVALYQKCAPNEIKPLIIF